MKKENNLIKHAKEELTRAGMFDKDSTYGGMLADAVMELLKVFKMYIAPEWYKEK